MIAAAVGIFTAQVSLLGLRVGSLLGNTLHSTDEPSKLSRYIYHDDNITHIHTVMRIIIMCKAGKTPQFGHRLLVIEEIKEGLGRSKQALCWTLVNKSRSSTLHLGYGFEDIKLTELHSKMPTSRQLTEKHKINGLPNVPVTERLKDIIKHR